MELDTEDGTRLRSPTREQLRVALNRLGLPGNGFAVLAKAEQHYIQAAGSRADGYVVEYREGSEETHHVAAADTLSHQEMVDLLTAYLEGGAWRSMVAWQPGFPRSSSAPSRAGKRVVALFIAIGSVSIVLGIYTGLRTYRFLQRAERVPGTVVALAWNGSGSAPVVEYVDRAGKRHTLRSTISSSPPSFSKGEQVTIAYEPQSPGEARIVTPVQLWFSTVFALVFGAMFVGVPAMALRAWRGHSPRAARKG